MELTFLIACLALALVVPLDSILEDGSGDSLDSVSGS